MINEDLKGIARENALPKEILKEPARIISLLFSIDVLKNLVIELLAKEIKDSQLTIQECFNLMKGLFMSKEIDYELIKKMAQQAKTFDDLILLFTAAFHYRKDDSYIGIVVKELSQQEISYKVWLEVLNYKDPWYFRISTSLERLTLLRIFESEVDTETIVSISYNYFKKSTFSTNLMLSALSSAKISADKWKDIKNLSLRKEIKELAEKKIDQLRKVENHQLICQT
jgi:hypothetical protein